MYTLAELAMLRAVDNNATIPGIDTKTGNQLTDSSLTQLSQIPQSWGGAYSYDPGSNIVRVIKAGAVLNGINFGAAEVMIEADNVTIENCTFTGTTGWFSVDQLSGVSGAIIKNNSFVNPAESLPLVAFIISGDMITIQNNTFIDSPGDAIDMTTGIVSGNYFSGAGYTSDGVHPDAIWVTNTEGPTLITNNFIDWTTNSTSTFYSNNAIRITTEYGNAENITVTGNYLIGGATTVDAGNEGSDGIFANVNVSNNYVGFATFSDFYPGVHTGVTETGNVIFDFSNPAYSANAWAAYQASGIVTNALVTATPSQISILGNDVGSTTLYGAGVEGAYLGGGAGENIIIGGQGKQYERGGSGKNIFTYLAIGDSTSQDSDIISNFNVATDVIDLHAINANPASSSTVNFTFIGSAAFSGAGGEVRFINDPTSGPLVEADLVGDSSADLVIRLNGVENLTAANFALTTAQYEADIASHTATISSFLGSQSSLDQVAGGFSIVDSLANVQPNLAALQADASHINAVTLLSGAISVNAATFAADQTILNKFAGGFAVVDTGAHVLAQIGALEQHASAITSVTLSDSTKASPDVLTLSAANAAADAAILAKIASPYVLTISTPAPAPFIPAPAAIVSVNVATFVANETNPNPIAGSFAVVDTGAHVLAQIGALEQHASAIASVTLSDSTAASPDVLKLSGANAAADAAALGKIASPYVLYATVSGNETVTGNGDGLTIDIASAQGASNKTVTITGGAAGDTFDFSSNFGLAEITDFGKYQNAAAPDTISLSTHEFANWSTLLADGRQSGANTVFTSGDGSRLTLDGVSLASLQHASAGLQAEFKFHA